MNSWTYIFLGGKIFHLFLKMKRKNGTKLGFPEWTQIRCSHSSHCPTEFFQSCQAGKAWRLNAWYVPTILLLLSNLNGTETLMQNDVNRAKDVRPWHKYTTDPDLKANSSCWMSQWLIWCSAQIVMNAEFAVPNCVQYITLAYPDANGEIWLPYENQLELNQNPVWKQAFFQQGSRKCPLCIFQETKARRIPKLFLHERNMGQSDPYCKERPFSEHNPQLLSTATIATVLCFNLLAALLSRSELGWNGWNRCNCFLSSQNYHGIFGSKSLKSWNVGGGGGKNWNWNNPRGYF